MKGCGENIRYVPGGITVFLTLIFGIILGLVSVTIENVRYLTGSTYMRTAAEGAALAVFGEYNRELYEEYGLFAYGGYGRKNSQEFAENFLEKLQCALDVSDRDGGKETMDIYRIQNILCTVEQVQSLTEPDVFYGQITDYIMVKEIKDLSQQLTGQYEQKEQSAGERELREQLDMTDAYERGDYHTEDTDQDQLADARTEEVYPGDEKALQSEDEGDPDKTQAQTTDGNIKEDAAGGNPLDTFQDLLRDGILYLVCDTDTLADGQSAEKTTTGTAGLLKDLLFGSGDGLNFTIQGGVRKAELLCYGNEVFSSYVNDKHRSVKYGLEYLATGKDEERDCLSGVVNRLLFVRTMMNYAYVNGDVALKEESFATATAIAGVLGIPALVTAIQQTILLILSVEESFVDITALLQGRLVPFVKTKTTFQMKYPEICTAGKNLFIKKAGHYEKSKGKFIKGYFDYSQYLWLFLLAVSENKLLERTYYLIEFDLRERFDQTFTLQQSIYGVRLSVSYSQPLLWSGFYGGDAVRTRNMETWHSYG